MSRRVPDLPTEVILNILQTVLSTRTIVVTVRSFEDSEVKATPEFSLSTTRLSKNWKAATYAMLNDGLKVVVDSPFAIPHLSTILPEAIRTSVKFLEVNWEQRCEPGLLYYPGEDPQPECEHHQYYEIEGGFLTVATLRSFPKLQAIFLDTYEDRPSWRVEEADDMDELQLLLKSNTDKIMRAHIEERVGIMLDVLDDFDRTVQVLVNVDLSDSEGTYFSVRETPSLQGTS